MQKASLIRCTLAAIATLWSLATAAVEVQQPLIVGNLEIFYGVIPAAVLLGHPADHTERTMHGGVPSRNAYHLVVSLFDIKTKERGTEARVRATLSQVGQVPQTKPLQSMLLAEARTYGNYFSLSGPGPFRITLDITRAHGGTPARVSFEHRQR